MSKGITSKELNEQIENTANELVKRYYELYNLAVLRVKDDFTSKHILSKAFRYSIEKLYNKECKRDQK